MDKFFRYKFLLITLLFLLISFSLCDKKKTNKNIKNYKKNTNPIKRKLNEHLNENGEFEDLKFHFDYNTFNQHFQDTEWDDEIKTNIKNSLEEAAHILESFLQIYISGQNLVIKPKLGYYEIYSWDNIFNETEPHYDFSYGVFLKLEELEDEIPAFTELIISDYFFIPRFCAISLNIDLEESKLQKDYLKPLFLHELTHCLGFIEDIIEDEENYYGIYNKEIEGEEITHRYIKSEKVINYAKKYFNCNNIIKGIEIKKDSNHVYHWSSRYLLGEYMTEFSYPEEQVISGFTLAFLEDLGYLRVKNKYTGGLMRFGKNKGCEFLNDRCINEDNEGTYISKKFENEFYYPKNFVTTYIEPSCSSGRLSRTVHKLISYNNDPDSLPDDYIYYFTSYQSLGGIPSTDYCPISQYADSNLLFEGLCSEIGTTSTLSDIIGESLSKNSFCALSSLVKKENEDYSYEFRAVCFKMYCSDQSLTIQVGEDYFVCPRGGGKIQGNDDFRGYLLCPDYNLICTGKKMCNNMFDCLSEGSEEKENTFDYNYEIKTTQDKYVYTTQDIISGWELSNGPNSTCPLYCSQCDRNKLCVKCGTHYKISNNICIEKIPNCIDYNNDESCKLCKTEYVLVEEENIKICKKESDFDISQYYLKNENGINYYKKCSEEIVNCYSCNSDISGIVCTKCITNYAIIDGEESSGCQDLSSNLFYKDVEDNNKYKRCPRKYTECNKCTQSINNIVDCIECNTGYGLINDKGIVKCQTITTLQNDNSLFRNNNGIYFSCSDNLYHSVKNCLNCQNKDSCQKCQNDYILFNSDKLCLSMSDIGQNIYFINTTDNFYYLCSKEIKGCEKCTSADTCIECNVAFELDENNKCIPTALALTRYYKDPSTGKYMNCSIIDNCEECSSSTTCTKCKNGYEINNNLCQVISTQKRKEESNNNDKIKALSIGAIILGTFGTVISIIAIVLILVKNLLNKNNIPQSETADLVKVNNEEPNEIVVQPINKRSIHNDKKE